MDTLVPADMRRARPEEDERRKTMNEDNERAKRVLWLLTKLQSEEDRLDRWTMKLTQSTAAAEDRRAVLDTWGVPEQLTQRCGGAVCINGRAVKRYSKKVECCPHPAQL